jgi:hypothetical protein
MCGVVSNHLEWSNLGRQVIITSSNGGMGKLCYPWQLVPLESKIGKVNDLSMVLPKMGEGGKLKVDEFDVESQQVVTAS